MGQETIWERLDAERVRRDPAMTRQAWAAFLGVSPAVYNNWRARGVPTSAYQSLMDKTRWTYDQLVRGLQEPASEKRVLSDRRQDEVESLLRSVNDQNRPLVLALLRAAIGHNMPLSPVKPQPQKRAIVGAPVTPVRSVDEQRSKPEEQGKQGRRRSG